MIPAKIDAKCFNNKLYYFFLALSLLLYTNTCFAQTNAIKSGEIYVLRSKQGKKVLDVSNASMDNGAVVDCWTNTGSDAERWTVINTGKNIYTLSNVASGKLLHIPVAPADGVNADQNDNTGNDNVKWVIKKAGNGSFFLKPLADLNFSLGLNADTVNGAKVSLAQSSGNDGQKWYFQQVSSQDVAPTPAIVDKVFDAWYTQYSIDTVKGFWDKAEMMEIVLDAYEVTKKADYLTKFGNMYNNFIVNNKADWMYNKYNDDITWAVLACVRGYLLSGNKLYLEKGKEQFDKMYARAFTNLYGGGLNWYETKTSKNSCINGPAMVACCYLAQATGDNTYYDKAIALYTWSKLYLFNPATGKVNDNVDMGMKNGKLRVSDWSSTYNQGTYLAAAIMLYNYTKEDNYLEEAKQIARYTRDNMYKGKVMDNEDGGNDLPGFKGIFVRYARKYAVEGNQNDLNEWLRLNAKVAYNNRNLQGLIQTKWGSRTNDSKPRSYFGTSTAVSLLINTLYLHQ